MAIGLLSRAQSKRTEAQQASVTGVANMRCVTKNHRRCDTAVDIVSPRVTNGGVTQETSQKDETDKGTTSGSTPRKERVIHTRVSVVLEQELKRLAGSLRVPVSNVVRTILEDAVSKVDMVGQLAEGEIRSVADRIEKHREVLRTGAVFKDSEPDESTPDEGEAEGSPPAKEPSEDAGALDGVVGFQPLLLAKPALCAVCQQPLTVGKEVFMGIRDDGGPRVIVGSDCLPLSQK